MAAREDKAAMLVAFKACMAKLDLQIRGMLPKATPAALHKGLWLGDEFTLPDGSRLDVHVSVNVRQPYREPEPLMIEGPKP